MIYPPAIELLEIGEQRKSFSIFLALSSTITPNAPKVVEIEVTARIPTISQLSIRNFVPSILIPETLSKLFTSWLPRKNAYKPITIKTASKEKNTELLSLKKSFKFLLANRIILLSPFLLLQ